MRTSFIIILSFLIFLKSNAQELSKTEKKAIKKELKSYIKNPESYVASKKECEDKTTIIQQQYEDIRTLQNENLLNKTESKAQIDNLNEVINKLRTTLTDGNSNYSTNQAKFFVQIGAYKNYDISKLLNPPVAISAGYINGLHKYFIGNFESYEDAEIIAEQLRKLGIKGAFVTQDSRNADKSIGTINNSPNNYSTIPNNTPSSKTNITDYKNGKKVNFTIDEIKSNNKETESLSPNNTNTTQPSPNTNRANKNNVIYIE